MGEWKKDWQNWMNKDWRIMVIIVLAFFTVSLAIGYSSLHNENEELQSDRRTLCGFASLVTNRADMLELITAGVEVRSRADYDRWGLPDICDPDRT